MDIEPAPLLSHAHKTEIAGPLDTTELSSYVGDSKMAQRRFAAFTIMASTMIGVGLSLADKPRGKPTAGMYLTAQPAKGRAARRAALMATPTAQLDAAKRRAEQLAAYHGVRIDPDPDAEDPDLQARISAAFALQEPIPQARLDHFAWIFAPGGCPTCWCNGWYGRIYDVKAADGGWLVTIAVAPKLASEEATHMSTPDSYRESYRFINGELSFVKGWPPEKVLRAIIID